MRARLGMGKAKSGPSGRRVRTCRLYGGRASSDFMAEMKGCAPRGSSW